MRYIIIFFTYFGFILNSNAQIKTLRFQKLLAENPDTEYAFSVIYEGQRTLEALNNCGIIIKNITPDFVYIQTSPKKMVKYQEQFNGRFHFEQSNPMLFNDTSRFIHYVDQVHQGLSLPQGYTGKGIIIGVVDTGVDWNHPDFKDSLGKTRVIRYWDHSINGPNPAMPYGYGQLWDSTDINNGTCTGIDDNNHGTTVAGSAAGNGLANGTNKGMAPDATIIIVESNFSLPNWTLTIADACDFVFKIADSLGMPAVVNLSVGDYLGSHDGNDPASDLIENLLDEKPGRLVVCAAGNSGAKGKYHQHGTASSDTSFVWFLNNPSNQIAPNSVYFDLWANLSDVANYNFAVGADNPSTFIQSGKTNFYNALTNQNTAIFDTIFNAAQNQIATVQYYTETVGAAFHLEVLVTNIDSTSYYFRYMTAGSGEHDLWSGTFLALNQIVSTLPTVLQMPDIIYYQLPDTLQTIVSSWACSEKVMTVGNSHGRVSYIDRNYNPYIPGDPTPRGKLSPNSSKGPSRNNTLKPDLVASGDLTLSAGRIPYLTNPGAFSAVDSGGWHMRNGGTSMSSPVVAGIGALYFERCPYATYAQFIQDANNTTFSDQYTGTLPNTSYGNGKINAWDLMQQLVDGTPSTISYASGIMTSTSAPGYQWLQDGVPISNATSQTFNVNPPYGQFSVLALSVDGCPAESNSIGVFLGLDKLAAESVLVYPNPSSGMFEIKSEKEIQSVALISMDGKRTELKIDGNGKYDLLPVGSGTYILEIALSNKVLHSKLIKN